jgi:thiamine pyrophosphate-dependent acetolactate synthase large subunit-like protein
LILSLQVGNDAGWTQIARDQEKILESSAACKLAHSDYHLVAEAFGGKGFLVR